MTYVGHCLFSGGYVVCMLYGVFHIDLGIVKSAYLLLKAWTLATIMMTEAGWSIRITFCQVYETHTTT